MRREGDRRDPYPRGRASKGLDLGGGRRTGLAERLRIGIAGARGRMGLAVAAIIDARPDLELAARFGRPGPQAGELAVCDVVIDFSTAAAAAALAALAAEAGGPALVIGATGFSEEQEAQIAAAAARIPIVKSGNFSLGVAVLAALVRQAAARLGPDLWDIEIVEAHHRHKKDAPSGTALLLGEAAAEGRESRLTDLRAPESRANARRPGTIGFASLRGGEIVGEHAVILAGPEEVLTLSHSARDRALFARGALAAAAWAHGRPPGLYGMDDVLGLR